MESSGNTRDNQIGNSLDPSRPTIESCTTDYDIYTTEAVSSQDELEDSSRNYQPNNNQSQSRGTILTDSDDDSTADEGASLISPSQKKNKRKNKNNSSKNERDNSRINTKNAASSPRGINNVNSRRRRTRVTDHPDQLVYVEQTRRAKRAIDDHLLPELIAQGSSGSYFMKARILPTSQSADSGHDSVSPSGEGEHSTSLSSDQTEIIAVFKPKNEEPYALLNPKWTKWIQRNICFCCFGRSCLISNQGFVSEAAASVVDTALGLNLVPLTGVVRLSAESFHYSKFHKMKAKAKVELSSRFPNISSKFRRIGLPPKMGSFQLFVKGYQGADHWLRKFEHNPPDEEVRDMFLEQFQKLTILDYIIRNTDRGPDNWLIRYDEEASFIKIAAIDNGLAFPYKHPDQWRTYPYSWSWLEMARKPYSETLREDLLSKLSDQKFISNLENKIQAVFKVDRSYSQTIFDRQMSVMRGQILNVTQALRDERSPVELVNMPPVYVKRADKNNMLGRLRSATIEQFTQTFQRQKPFFSGF